MKTTTVIFARIYLMESSHQGHEILHYLKNEAKVRGVTVYRGVRGFGETGEHSSSLVDLSLDLPMTIEFFDRTEKMEKSLEHLCGIVKPEHLVYWEAKTNL
jgi:PII-like signaling protein